MRVIHRHEIAKDRSTTNLTMPRGSEILNFAATNNMLSLWAIVETNEPLELRRFCLVWTGREPPHGLYIGTAQTYEESVPPGYGHPAEQVVVTWHLFEIAVTSPQPFAPTER